MLTYFPALCPLEGVPAGSDSLRYRGSTALLRRHSRRFLEHRSQSEVFPGIAGDCLVHNMGIIRSVNAECLSGIFLEIPALTYALSACEVCV